eukprot:gene3661-4559_t
MNYLIGEISKDHSLEEISNIDNIKNIPLINLLLKNIDKDTLKGNFIDLETIKKSLHDINVQNNIDLIEQDVLKVIDAFKCPLFNYDQGQKKFIKVEDNDKSFHGSAKSKTELFKRRYLNILQRVQRNSFFSQPVLPSDHLTRNFNSITPLSSLLGSSGEKYVLGMITQITEGQYYLEDTNTNVPLDLSHAKLDLGLVTENSIVIARGEFINNCFHADKLILPFIEEREQSLSFLNGVDLFGEMPPKRTIDNFKNYEETREAPIVFLSDVWLDSIKVMNKLEILFKTHQSDPPFAYILMGNFTENPLLGGTQYKLKQYFNSLATLILKFPPLLKSKFIFVPGPTDPTGSLLNILPKFPIPNTFTKEFQQKITNSIFTTNPCRIRYCTQEMIIFRDDLVTRMRRHCIIEPTSDNDISDQLVLSIFSNSHLCNLSLESRPVYWNYDHALSIYPLPDLLVLGDKSNQFDHKQGGCKCLNPSSFSTDYSFSLYMPSTKDSAFCKIDDDDEEEEEQQEEQDEMVDDINQNNGEDEESSSTQNNNNNSFNGDDDDMDEHLKF